MEYIQIFLLTAVAMVGFVWLRGPEEREENIRAALVVMAGTALCLIIAPYS